MDDLDGALFDANDFDAPIRLRDRYLAPPFSTLNRREGAWQARKRAWLDVGLRSTEGRDAKTYEGATGEIGDAMAAIGDADGQSVFDPVLAELIVTWFTAPGVVVDPYAGGSVRGVVAGALGRDYYGIDVSEEQVAANRLQLDEMAAQVPNDVGVQWAEGDALSLLAALPDGHATGGVYTCPPYYDLEVYTDHPMDISAWAPSAFDVYVRKGIREQYRVSGLDTFATWVVSEVRDKTSRNGAYRGLVPKTIAWHLEAGYDYYQEAILLDPIGTAMLRAPRTFEAAHKLVPVHQNVLVFVKGDARRATDKIVGR